MVRTRESYCRCILSAIRARLKHPEKILVILHDRNVGRARHRCSDSQFGSSPSIKATDVRIKAYGFDTGGELPELAGTEDFRYWFRPSRYSMDVERLRRRRLIPLSQARLYVVVAPR